MVVVVNDTSGELRLSLSLLLLFLITCDVFLFTNTLNHTRFAQDVVSDNWAKQHLLLCRNCRAHVGCIADLR